MDNLEDALSDIIEEHFNSEIFNQKEILEIFQKGLESFSDAYNEMEQENDELYENMQDLEDKISDLENHHYFEPTNLTEKILLEELNNILQEKKYSRLENMIKFYKKND